MSPKVKSYGAVGLPIYDFLLVTTYLPLTLVVIVPRFFSYLVSLGQVSTPSPTHTLIKGRYLALIVRCPSSVHKIRFRRTFQADSCQTFHHISRTFLLRDFPFLIFFYDFFFKKISPLKAYSRFTPKKSSSGNGQISNFGFLAIFFFRRLTW